MPDVGDLIHTTAGTWITRPPTRCPNGQLGADQVLVGHQACLGHGGGHTTWTCRTCDQTVYGPPLNTHCTRSMGLRPCGFNRTGLTASEAGADNGSTGSTRLGDDESLRGDDVGDGNRIAPACV